MLDRERGEGREGIIGRTERRRRGREKKGKGGLWRKGAGEGRGGGPK